MRTLLQDLRFGLRLLRRSPGFAALAIFTLALGIGSNTAIFSAVNRVLLRPLPFGEPERLVMIWGSSPAMGSNLDLVSPADFEDWRSLNSVFEEMAGSRDASYSLTGDGEPESVSGYRYSSDFFHVLGVGPLLGRTFLPDEDHPGSNRVVVLGHGLWQRRFGADPSIVGKSIILNDEPYAVIGVMREGFAHPQGSELWTPLAMDPNLATSRSRRFLRVVARLRPGVGLAQAQVEMNRIAGQLAQQYPDTNTSRGAKVVTLRSMYVGDIEPALLALLGAVGFVLLIACANVAHLSLARVADRQKEIAIRAAMGAGRPRLFRQLLTESLLLSLLGGTLGLVVALWSSGFLVSMFPNNIANLSIPRVTEIPIDGRVLTFTLVVTMFTAVLFGLAPALQTTGLDVNGTLKQAARGVGSGGAGRRSRSLLVVAEIAVAVVLVAGAGLMIRSFLRLQQIDLGLDPANVLTEQVLLPQSRYSDLEKRRLFVDAVLRRLESLPGARSVAATNYLPLTGFWGIIGFEVEGHPPFPPGEEPSADDRIATPGYFRTMGIRIVEGREFTTQDDESSRPVIIVNETMARRFWPGQSAVGRRVNLGDADDPSWCEIVGVVGDVKAFGPDQETHAEIHRPFAQVPFPLIAFVVRASSDPLGLAAAARQEIWSVDRLQPVFKTVTMDQLVSDAYTLRRISMLLMGSLAALAILLAAVGVYGVTAYSVSRRTQEIGLRVALGARPRDVLRMIGGQGLGPVAAGVVFGLIVSLGVTRLLSSLLFGVGSTDPVTFACVPLLLMSVAGLAIWIPARRAIKVDPIVALRQE